MPVLLPPAEPSPIPQVPAGGSVPKAAEARPHRPAAPTPRPGFWQRPYQGLGISITGQQAVFMVLAGFCLTPWATPALALALGLTLAQTVGNPFPAQARASTAKLLQYSIVGLGFGLDAHAAVAAGRAGLLFTVASISGTLALGYVVGRWLGLSRQLTHLISCGTAICGGSAIAAVGPVLRAKDEDMTVALGTVFVLNAVALFAFPPIGQALHLSQQQFGLWCAIAIHDTSSVVGAATAYGDQALQVATTVKLARALWIVPIALASAWAFRQKGGPLKFPYFILGFVAAVLLHTFVPALQPAGPFLTLLAKRGLTLTLFLIGAGLSMRVIRSVGMRPFGLGVLLWGAISVISLYAIRHLV